MASRCGSVRHAAGLRCPISYAPGRYMPYVLKHPPVAQILTTLGHDHSADREPSRLTINAKSERTPTILAGKPSSKTAT